MVSLQAALSLEEKKPCVNLENPISKKRRREDEEKSDVVIFSSREAKTARGERANSDIELNLETPLPLEWQRCLDIKSGQIHYYNTRTNKRTNRDPRESPEQATPPPSLDLDLNLTCVPPKTLTGGEERAKTDTGIAMAKSIRTSSLPPWMSLAIDRQEMVATVCMRCHMLVMMSKATLSCPNCKFVHPPTHASSNSVKPGFKLLCCKD
ncbi:uncharacterized protein [Typha latifolia]|uniref:uncharacterized protein n=1 Tax=Typha latifolia TaxID=4733 RepID=UPI003C2B4A02